MLYTVTTTNRAVSQVETWDEKIIAATPALRWAIGLSYREFELKCCEYGSYVEVQINQSKRQKQLGTGPWDDSDRKPSDTELFSRVSASEV